MAFGNISTLYLPTAANAGASQWGTDVRKLLDSADAGSDATTKTNHGTGGSAVVRTCDPYTTTTADLDQSLYGWAVTPTDMNSVTGALRFYPAGDHVATIRLGHTAAVAKAANLVLYAYRVSSAAGGRARTLLGSVSGASVNIAALGGEITATATLTLGEIIFAADETIQYSFEINAAGTVITGDVVTFFTGTQTSVACRIDTPKLGVLAETTGTSADSLGTATGVTGKVLGTVGSSAGTGAAAGVGASRADTTGTAAGSSTVSGQGSSVAGTVGTAAGSCTVSGLTSIVLGTVGTVEIGAAGSGDFPVTDPTRAIAGTVLHHETGLAIASATVRLIRDSDGLLCATDTTGGDGSYSFPRDTLDPYTYHVSADYLDGSTQIHGLSDRGLIPA